MSLMPSSNSPQGSGLAGLAMNPTPMGAGMFLGSQVIGSMKGGGGAQKADYHNGQWYFGGRPVSPDQMKAYGAAYKQGPAGQGTMWDVNNSRSIVNGMRGNTTDLTSKSYNPGINRVPLDTQNFNNIAGLRINEYANEHGIANPFNPVSPAAHPVSAPTAPAQQPTAPHLDPTVSGGGGMDQAQITQGEIGPSANIQAPTFSPAAPLQPQMQRRFAQQLRAAPQLPPTTGGEMQQ